MTPGPPVVPAKIRMPGIKALPRDRLQRALRRLWDHRLGLVVAPAGSGKTTLLAQVASAVDSPVAWYRAEGSDGDAATFLRYLEAAAVASLPGLAGGWGSVEEAARALEAWPGARALIVIDDLHAIRDTPAESALERLVEYAAPAVAVLAASRFPPGFNLSRARVAGSLLEIGPDDLRFRTWEVERLFCDFYGEPLGPEDLAQLAHRTAGWAAGLQLFHLATRGKPLEERRRILGALGARSKLVRDYLARNILDELPSELRSFLLATCVLGRLSGRLCDDYLRSPGSRRLLEDLEGRQILVRAADDNGYYLCHEVMRSYLEATFVDELGEAEGRTAYLRAAVLLEASGALPEALWGYCRGEDWAAVARLLGREGEQIALGTGAWLDLLPQGILRADPWLLVATARRHRAAGRWNQAMDAYRRAEDTFGLSGARDRCRLERLALAVWLEPVLVAPADPHGIVRAASIRDPLLARQKAEVLPGAGGRLAAGLCALLAGHLRQARTLMTEAATAQEAGPLLSAGSRLGAAIAGLLAGDANAESDLALAAEESERLGVAWLARMSRAALALGDRPDGLSEAASVRLACDADGDRWGSCLAALFEGLGALRAKQSRAKLLEQAASDFASLGAGTLEAWCRSARAATLAGVAGSKAAAAANEARASARATGARAPLAFAYLALARVDAERGVEYEALARAIADECGLRLPTLQAAGPAGAAAPAGPPPPMAVRCFGGFQMSIAGRTPHLAALKPRARELLRLLALNAGILVHHERLVEALWPEAEAATGKRNLHVAVSSLRHVLEPDTVRGTPSLIVRDGDAYKLAIPPGADIDVIEFDRALVRGRAARASRDVEGALRSFARALDLHVEDLLPEDGPAEWVVRERERRRLEAVEAAAAIADLLMERGEHLGAAIACERGLTVDRYRDGLWRRLIQAQSRAGHRAAAARAQELYNDVLAELGLPPTNAFVPA